MKWASFYRVKGTVEPKPNSKEEHFLKVFRYFESPEK